MPLWQSQAEALPRLILNYYCYYYYHYYHYHCYHYYYYYYYS